MIHTRVVVVVAFVASLVFPGCHRGTTDADLDDLERRYAEDRRRIDGVAVDLTRLTVTQRQIVATYVAAKRQWEETRIRYQESASKSDLAGRTAEQAAADFATAERYYRAAAIAMVTISTGSLICGGEMSTAAYRRDLERKGMPMDRLEDVDHIFPKSRGGIDHPLNYQPLHRSLNRSLGNKVVDNFMQAPSGFLTGMAVSALGKIGGCH
jgi:hypothetical protein